MSFEEHFLTELEKIAEEKRRGGFLRAAALIGTGIAGVAGTAYAAHRGGQALKGAIRREVDSAADVLASRIGAGIRDGVRTGFEDGVKDLQQKAPDIASSMAERLEPRIQTVIDTALATARKEVDSAMEAAAGKAKAEAPEVGERLAGGFAESIRKKLPRLPFGG